MLASRRLVALPPQPDLRRAEGGVGLFELELQLGRFCAGGGQGCYYVVNGSKITCSDCNDLTDCAYQAGNRCQGN